MALLRQRITGRTSQLEHDHVVGRASTCSLAIGERYISVQHAVLRFDGSGWELRDLGSRNGTFLNGVRIAAGEVIRLSCGASISFGRREQEWILTDDSPPSVMAIPLDGSDPVLIDCDLLALPAPENPVVSIYRSGDGDWILEQPHSVAPIADRHVFDVGGRLYRFSCQSLLNQTSIASNSLEAADLPLSLVFAVSRDEEHVQISVTSSGTTHDLGDRAHNYLLLTLARRRLADAAEGLPDTSCGWIYQDDFASDPSMVPPQLNLNVFRIRKRFAALQLPNSGAIIERRPGTKQLRLGTGRVTITTT
jgi:hypothetical protein